MQRAAPPAQYEDKKDREELESKIKNVRPHGVCCLLHRPVLRSVESTMMTHGCPIMTVRVPLNGQLKFKSLEALDDKAASSVMIVEVQEYLRRLKDHKSKPQSQEPVATGDDADEEVSQSRDGDEKLGSGAARSSVDKPPGESNAGNSSSPA